MSTAILDIDGTLVDTNYHHTISWARAFARHDIVVPLWRIHRHIGMGGDQLVVALCGEQVEDELGDEIRDAESEEYMQLIGEVRPMEGARELIVALKERGHAVVLASSAKERRGRSLPRPARRARAGRRVDDVGRRGEHQAGAGSRARRAGRSVGDEPARR